MTIPFLAALQVGKGVYDAVNANQQYKKQKGYLDAAYKSGQQRLGVRQGDVRESETESLDRRGLGTGSNVPFQAAMSSGGVPVQTSGVAPTTLGTQGQSDLAKEFSIQSNDLTQQYNQAVNAAKAGRDNAEIGSIESGIGGAVDAYGLGKISSAMGSGAGGLPAGVTQSSSGVDSPAPSFGHQLAAASYMGIHPTDPLGHPGSAWHTPGLSSGGSARQTGDFNAV